MLKKLVGVFEGKGKKEDNKPKPRVAATTTTTTTVGRYLTHLQTDKTIYRPKETVYLRGFILNAFDHSTLPPSTHVYPTIEIISPKGDKVVSGTLATPVDSVVCYSWEIPENQGGGDYKFELSYPSYPGFAFTQREFNIRVFRPPRLKTQLEFVKKGYGAGDTAQAKLSVERAEGGFPEGAKVTAVARIDGSEVARNVFAVDSGGKCLVSFALPLEIDVGVGTLSCVIEDGGVVETASKTIPILLKAMDVKIYPEGGYLVVGLKSPFYFEAFTVVGDPADLTADICFLAGGVEHVVGSVSTQHEGRGRGEFTPEAGKQYFLRVTKPTGITHTVPLPAALPTGVVLSPLKKTYEYSDNIELTLGATTEGKYEAQLFKRDVLITSQTIIWKKSSHTSSEVIIFANDVISKESYFDGVLRVTIHDDNKNLPVAERLIFRKPPSSLKIEITHATTKSSYTPADLVKLDIVTKNAVTGNCVSAVVGVIVTDDSVRQLTEKRKQPPRVTPMVYLEDEVDHLDDAHVYFKHSKKEGKPDTAIDLLLGTQGWRKFIYEDTKAFIMKDKKRAERLFAVHEVDRVIPKVVQSSRSSSVQEDRVVMRKKEKAAPAASISESASAAAPPPQHAEEEAESVPMKREEEEEKEEEVEEKEKEEAVNVNSERSQKIQKEERSERDVEDLKEDIADIADLADEDDEEAQQEEKSKKKSKKRDRDEVKRRRRRSPVEKERRPVTVAAIRVYAHKVRPGRQITDRVDFRETLYWNAGIVTNAEGRASIEFSLNDSITTFRVMADGVHTTTLTHSPQSTSSSSSPTPTPTPTEQKYGLLGQADLVFDSKQPFYVEPKMPLEITSGDVIQLPFVVVNNTQTPLDVATRHTTSNPALKLLQTDTRISVQPADRLRQLLSVEVADYNGDVSLTVSASADELADKVTRTTRVMPRGFPYKLYAAGVVQPNSSEVHEFTIPDATIFSSITTTAQVYASPMANLTEALKALLQEPCGCFEQTSSTVFPLTMAQAYFKSHDGVDVSLISRADTILQKGYQRLVGFECKKGGYDWFGNDPASEMLTSFGILEFTEISKVMNGVDMKMVERTKEWLLDRRDGKGSFKLNTRVLHTWDTAQDIADAYIVYSLTSAGVSADVLRPEIQSLKTRLLASKDPYLLALLANILYTVGDLDDATAISDKLTSFQIANGCVQGAATTVTQSGGTSLLLETTAMCMIAWLKDTQSDWTSYANKGCEYLFKNSTMGAYYNTQATVLALQAIIMNDARNSKPKAGGAIRFIVDGEVLQTTPFDEKSEATIPLISFAEAVSLPGAHTVELSMIDGSPLNYALELSYSADVPGSDPECAVEISKLTLSNPVIEEGEGTEINVTLTNKQDKHVPMTVAIIGLPGGLELRHEKMKELVKSEKIDAYEVLGARRVVCYFRSLAPKQEISFCVDVVASVPGKYTGPASDIYLYYTNEYKHWVAGLQVTINPRK